MDLFFSFSYQICISPIPFKILMPESSAAPIYQQIYNLVKQIPPGKVATYGQIANLLGYYGHARQVGYALFRVAPEDKVPWQRVINAQGKVSRAYSRMGNDDLQQQLLEDEGLEFNQDGKILNLSQHLWQPNPQELGLAKPD
jgi:methylated-DNA-protein-cysteine methyltransferase related protein